MGYCPFWSIYNNFEAYFVNLSEKAKLIIEAFLKFPPFKFNFYWMYKRKDPSISS